MFGVYVNCVFKIVLEMSVMWGLILMGIKCDFYPQTWPCLILSQQEQQNREATLSGTGATSGLGES